MIQKRTSLRIFAKIQLYFCIKTLTISTAQHCSILTIQLFQSMFSNFCIYVWILQREKQQTEHSKIIKFNFQTSSLYVQYYLDCQTNEQACKHMFPNNQLFLLKKCWHYFCCWSWSLIKQASKNEQTHKCSKYYKLSNTWVIVTNTKTNTISNFSFDYT